MDTVPGGQLLTCPSEGQFSWQPMGKYWDTHSLAAELSCRDCKAKGGGGLKSCISSNQTVQGEAAQLLIRPLPS